MSAPDLPCPCVAVLATQPEYLSRNFVSEKNKGKGIYTLKFYKFGKWRYVHIDDRIPCDRKGELGRVGVSSHGRRFPLPEHPPTPVPRRLRPRQAARCSPTAKTTTKRGSW